MIRTDLRHFYDNDENINHSVISLNVFTETITEGIHSLKNQIENFCQVYKDSLPNDDDMSLQNYKRELQFINDAWTSFKNSLDQIDIDIRSYNGDMREYTSHISKHLRSFELLQKQRDNVRNKSIRLQSSAVYEKDIAPLNDAIKKNLQAYSTHIKLYNDKVDELQKLKKYLNRTDSSSQSSNFNQLIAHWNVVLDNFEHLIGFIKNDSVIVNNMKQALFTFVSSMQTIQLIKLRELENVENQTIENSSLIENLQKQVSDLTEKNSELLNSVETLRKNLDEQQIIDLNNDKEDELINKNNKLKKELSAFEAENKKLSKQYDATVRDNTVLLEQIIQKDTNLQEVDILKLKHQQKLNPLTTEKEKLINENNELKKLHDEDNEANENLLKQLDEQRKTINQLNLQRDELHQKLMNEFGERKQKMLDELRYLREQLSTVENQLSQKQDHNNSLMLESQKLQEQNNTQEGKIKNLREELVRTNFRISDLENQLKTLQQQTLALKTGKQSRNQKEIELEQKYEEEKSENESLKIQIQELKNKLLVQAGPSAETSTKVPDESHVDWENEKTKLNFRDSYVTASIDSIDENNWNTLQKQIKELNQKLNGLHDKLATAYTRFEAVQKLRNKDIKIMTFSDEMENIIKEIRQQLEINRPIYSQTLEKLILEINTNYEKDLELHKHSQSVYINLTNSIKKDYSKKENKHKKEIRRLTAKQETATSSINSNKIIKNLEKEKEKWKKNKTETNIALKELQEQITRFIERYNERNEKRKKLLFSIQSHLVNNIYSDVINELLINLDKLMD
ncbi:putative leucine-rich repeat-containing protein DDB_G0290503 [Chelonus insularis]|uniref:putative leucine-rich repeat-containing protein DDB_G0290503 n=1 Tax=Chelonus insularis TaxID=460826 RepID=UPI00158A7BD3|nr:putative leucine-rich repeat-containing protein DDB_G0290503 [Chelonus insularis]